jgi:hypothetical protein
MQIDGAIHRRQTGEPESDGSHRIRELLTSKGGHIFHATRVTVLAWAHRLSSGNLRAVQAIAGHTTPKMTLRYQHAEMDYLAAVADNVSTMIESGTRTRSVPSGREASSPGFFRRSKRVGDPGICVLLDRILRPSIWR